jgi:hypothetical protein
LKELAPEKEKPSRKSVRTSGREAQLPEVPIGAASGNPADTAMEEFNLTEKTKEPSFGDINSIVGILLRHKKSIRKNKYTT